jgi:hypothetical protein
MLEWCADLKNIVQMRRGGRDREVPPETVRKLLAAVIGDFSCRTDAQGEKWNPAVWRTGFTASPADNVTRIDAISARLPPIDHDNSRQIITRSDVFACRSDPRMLFLAVMAWGYGLSGYGPHRARKVLEKADAAGGDTIDRAIEELRRCAAPQAIWRAFSSGGRAKLHGLGPAFASKLAYFACYDRSAGVGPLIADLRSAWGFWAIDGSLVEGSWDIRKTADLYARYVAVAAYWANELGARSDDIERALFVIGPSARSAWC